VLTGDLSPDDFEAFLAGQPDLGQKQWPRYVRLMTMLPRTATNKVLKRELQAAGLAGLAGLSSGATWTRDERGTTYR
jgi:fatty-acyl-CoA synthase